MLLRMEVHMTLIDDDVWMTKQRIASVLVSRPSRDTQSATIRVTMRSSAVEGVTSVGLISQGHGITWRYSGIEALYTAL